MKKVLFATSALVAFVNVASAEVAVTGDGRLGMIYDGEDIQFSSRARAKFTMTGETDSGLTFGGSFRVDQENYSAAPASRSAAKGTAGSVFVSGTYGKLSMGDVVSAAEAAIGDLTELGYTAGEFAGDPEEIDYLTGDGANENQGPTALYEYTINGVKVFASMSDNSQRRCDGTMGALGCYDYDSDNDTDLAYSVAAGYEFGAYNVALAYSKWGDQKEMIIGGNAAFDAFKVKAFYAKYDSRVVGNEIAGDDDFGDSDLPPGAEYDSAYGVSVGYTLANGVGLNAEWITRELDFNGSVLEGAEEKYDAYGIGASYDLGGGATLAGAVVKNELYQDGETRADMGVMFKF